jgi:outer membrane protein
MNRRVLRFNHMHFLSLQRLILYRTIAAAMLLTAPCVQAQSLAQVYETARGYDATYLAAQASAQSAQYKQSQAHALRRPVVGASMNASANNNKVPISDTQAKTYAVGINAKQTLYNAANSITINQAQHQLEIANNELAIAEQELMVRVAQTYLDVLNTQDTLSTAQANKKAITEQLASAKRNFEVGTATITDTREAQARFDLSQAQEIAAENDVHIKHLNLDQLVGQTGTTPYPLTNAFELPALAPDHVETWVQHASNAPTVRKAAAAYAMAKDETQKAKAGHLPTLDLEAGYQTGHSNTQGTQGSQQIRAVGSANQSSIGITLRVPVFAGYAIENRVKETLLLQEQARNNLAAVERTVVQAARQAFFGVRSGAAQIKALEAARASTKLALEATQLGYKVGVRVNVDVLNAQTQLYTTQRDVAKAKYDYLINGLKLRQVVGQLSPDDLRAVSQILTP